MKLILKSSSLLVILVACKSFGSKDVSGVTGWKYNDKSNGNVERTVNFKDQATGPGLVLIEGGSFLMGRVEQDLTYAFNSTPRRVTVSSFYIDEVEITNQYYRDYLNWLNKAFVDFPEVHQKALPDTLVWRKRLGYNEPFVENYFRHPAFTDHPVVGVSWLQANEYCLWRSDRVNEAILVKHGYLKFSPEDVGDQVFNTDAYLAGQYTGSGKIERKDGKNATWEDGIMLPKYRLPTEAEWEYAASGLVGSKDDELFRERRIYPWDGHSVRSAKSSQQGRILANFKRSHGDMMGVAGRLNDGYEITAPVYSFEPNDYGLYNMAGNVSEWVLDTYRPLSSEDVEDFRPFRGNIFTALEKNEDGTVAEKDSIGRLKRRILDVKKDNLAERRNYQEADNLDYKDGHWKSSVAYLDFVDGESPEDVKKQYENEGKTTMYAYGKTSLISNKSKVYKGGSWRDRAYWMSPGTRRFLEEDMSTDYIGFRCAMDRVGSFK